MAKGSSKATGKTARLYRARQAADGSLRAVVQIEETATEKILYDRFANLSRPSDFEEVVDDLKGHIDEPREWLMEQISLQRKLIAEEGEPQAAPQPSKYSPQAKWIAEQLETDEKEGITGRFLTVGDSEVDATPKGFWFGPESRFPVDVTSKAMSLILWHKFGLNEADLGASYFTNHLYYHAVHYGDPVALRRTAHYDPLRNRLYVDMANGMMCRLDGKKVSPVRNGTDGVLFAQIRGAQPWHYVEDHGFPLGPEFVEKLNFAQPDPDDEMEGGPFTQEQQRLMFYVWLVSFMFRSEMPTRAIAVGLGERGSGKTTAFRRVGQILFGPDFSPDAIDRDKQDDFWTAVTNRPFVVLDNLDSGIPWVPDALAQVSTGIKRSKRKLHTTNDLEEYQADAFLAITARTPRFGRDDVADRLLIFQFERLADTQRRPDKELNDWIGTNRDRLMSELVDRANKVLDTPRRYSDSITIRMADFASIAEWIGESMKVRQAVREALESMKAAQSDLANEQDIVAVVISEWCQEIAPGGAGFKSGKEYKATDLAEDLANTARRIGYRRWPVKGAQQLGHYFKIHRSQLAQQFDIHRGRGGNNGTVYKIFLKTGEVPSEQFEL